MKPVKCWLHFLQSQRLQLQVNLKSLLSLKSSLQMSRKFAHHPPREPIDTDTSKR